MKNYQRIPLLFLLIFVLVLSGCQSGSSKNKIDSSAEGYMELYYLNASIEQLIPEPYILKAVNGSLKAQIAEVMKRLSVNPKDKNEKAPLSGEVRFLNATLEDGYVTLNFNVAYKAMEPAMEILCRAAIVKTITGISQINSVEFTVDGQPLTDRDGQLIGIMTEEAFVDNSGDSGTYNQFGEVNLFFANEKGNQLVEQQTHLEVSNTIPIEQQMIEALIKGPADGEPGKAAIPKETKVIKTSVKDGICYVDMNQHFLDPMPDVKDEITIYSIVNSLVELPTVNKVQFTIEGKKIEKYRETLAFDGFFERKLELIEVKK